MERTFSSAGFVLLTYVVKMERRYLQKVVVVVNLLNLQPVALPI